MAILEIGTNSSVSFVPSMSIDRLFPALLECFGIILCGYVAGRVNIITSTQAKGLGSFVSKFALPGLLFKNMVVLNFVHVNWNFLWSVLVAKVAVFIIVCTLTLLIASPENRFGKAGLFPIFATQSNDFALGYPIVEALYRDTYPEYLQYIYLVAPISLMLLNPIGFIFCEIQKWRENMNTEQSKLKTVALVLLQVFKNPIVFMVIVGICGNFIFERKIPVIIGEFLDGLASSFSGSALFYLGLTMVGQIKKLKKNSFVAIILLITAKLLVLPLISREMVELLDNGNTEANYTSLSNYAFFYGIFPTAPSVAIYASQYNMEIEIVTPGMVINTFVSAPIMYVSAWLLTIPSMHTQVLQSAIQSISFDISIVTLVFLVWSVAVMLLSKKFKQLPHLFSINLLLAQSMVCLGMIMWYVITKQNTRLGQVLVFIVLYCSLYSTYVWTGLIALSLLLLEKNASKQKGFFIIAGWGIPAFIVGILLLTGHPNTHTLGDSAFFYGNTQVISTAAVLSCSIILAGSSLMLLSRKRHDNAYQILQRDSISSNTSENPSRTTATNVTPDVEFATGEEICPCQMENQSTLCYSNQQVQNNGISINEASLSAEQCTTSCNAENCILIQEEQHLQNTDPQLARHVLLCLLLIVGLFANVSSCLWWLVNHEPGRLYVELQFFCIIFNFGQGFISFGIFGLDKHLIILSCKKRLEFLLHGRNLGGQTDDPLTDDIRLTCQQFSQYHMGQCARDIVKARRCGAETFTDIFRGCDLVDWLIQVGLAHDRGEAVKYGDQLLEGGAIRHITNEYSFQDESLYYRMSQINEA
ncbi:lysosomal cholesterol signaling protein isoform X1 [Hemiscyllium ocellatum]|uniref:lysosomal cholesterol signaling protein isoform X1 n=1 Tax=Hemiscyllium ocellatum TaxID=170820 RepID=UPI0029663208|nr:lysosomal cholesterol signaling protein isoform X1 [Hemiscyllium ocellatum]XP_060683300.1 lysosomal cholesterol signaling protein isoform X1 [Hemiscyllium ocellatum]